jgi:hypothetical protein
MSSPRSTDHDSRPGPIARALLVAWIVVPSTFLVVVHQTVASDFGRGFLLYSWGPLLAVVHTVLGTPLLAIFSNGASSPLRAQVVVFSLWLLTYTIAGATWILV